MIFLAEVSACGTAAKGTSHTSDFVSAASCATSSDAPSGDQSYGYRWVSLNVVSGSSLWVWLDQSISCCGAASLDFSRVYTSCIPSGDHCGPVRLYSSAIIGTSRPSTSDFSHRPQAPARITEKATCPPSRDRFGNKAVLPAVVIGWPASVMRPVVASNGKSQFRICCDFAVKANRRPSLETAKLPSGPGPVVSRSSAVARNVSGSTIIFQMLIAPLYPH